MHGHGPSLPVATKVLPSRRIGEARLSGRASQPNGAAFRTLLSTESQKSTIYHGLKRGIAAVRLVEREPMISIKFWIQHIDADGPSALRPELEVYLYSPLFAKEGRKCGDITSKGILEFLHAGRKSE